MFPDCSGRIRLLPVLLCFFTVNAVLRKFPAPVLSLTKGFTVYDRNP